MEIREYDVVCVGGGGAGVTAAVTAAKRDAKVALISKEPIGYGNTRIALGGIVYPRLSEEDSPQRFLNDLFTAGEGLNNPKVAETLAHQAPKAAVIAESFGYTFRRDSNGQVNKATSFGATGGHSAARALSSDMRGTALGQALRAAAVRAKVDLFEQTMVTRLLVRNGHIEGIVSLRLIDSEVLVFSAKSVVLATGGVGWIYYPHTDCFRSATGDGYALALAAGAELVDMEQIQFLPFGFTHPRAKVGVFIGDSLNTGSAGRLLNAKDEVIIPKGMNTMTRAQLTEAIAREMAKGNMSEFGGLKLDLLPNLSSPEAEDFQRRLRHSDVHGLIRTAYGLKAYNLQEPWDVCPTAHFTMGGIRIDELGNSTIQGLYAAGEAAGGLHGGNRLGGVAFTEIFLFGQIAGEQAAKRAKERSQPKPYENTIMEEVNNLRPLVGKGGSFRPVELIRRLQRLMWEKVGVIRSATSCREALEELEGLTKAAQALRVSDIKRYNTELADALELQFMLINAEAIARSALERNESRGAHFRTDHPQRKEAEGQSNVVVWKDDGRIKTKRESVR